MALRHGIWMDEESFKKTCIKEKKKRGGIHQPFYGIWVADFMLRRMQEGLCWESIWVTKKMSIHQYLKSEKIFEQIELLTKPTDYFW